MRKGYCPEVYLSPSGMTGLSLHHITPAKNLHQWPCIPLELRVVIGAIDDSFHLIHVGLPVDFCIYSDEDVIKSTVIMLLSPDVIEMFTLYR